MNSSQHPHSLNLFAPHPHLPHFHLPHPHLPHLPHPHWHHPGTTTAGAHVGRIGTLAVAMGVGTAAGAGFCAACAYADTGNSTTASAGPAAPTTSQSAGPVRTAGSAKVATSQAGATARGATARRIAVQETDQTVAVALPGKLASSADELTGNAPAVPTDAAIAGLLAAARREPITPVRMSYKSGASIISAASPVTSVEGEKLVLTSSGGGRVVTDRTASSGSALVLTSSTTATTTVLLPDSTALVIRAKATVNSGSPTMTVSLDGVPITTVVVASTSWADYTLTGVIPAGAHVLSISSSNSTNRRSLYIDTLRVSAGPLLEDFTGNSGSAPNTASWSIKTGTGWDPGLENYRAGNVSLDGAGNLILKATRSKSGYSSGWVETKNKISFGYGTITARIKVPSGQGLWPAFWLKGANEDTVPWPQSGEVDVLELPSTTTTIYSTLHGPISGSTATQQAQIISTVPDLSTGYHNFWVRHLPNEITFGVDDQTLGTLTPASLAPDSQWVYDQPLFAILNLAVGGPWAGAPDSSTVFPASMTVDWVRWDPP